MLKQIISGGQTGADRGALDAAIKLNFPYGGWLPKGRKTEEGALSEKYQLKEMHIDSYKKRTEQNVIDSDATVIISHGTLTGGSKLTLEYAVKHNRPYLHIDLKLIDYKTATIKISKWITDHNIETLNVAGTRNSKDPLIYQSVSDIIEKVINLQASHV